MSMQGPPLLREGWAGTQIGPWRKGWEISDNQSKEAAAAWGQGGMREGGTSLAELGKGRGGSLGASTPGKLAGQGTEGAAEKPLHQAPQREAGTGGWSLMPAPGGF